MRALARVMPLTVLLFLPGWAWSQERNRFADVLALQQAVRQSIKKAEPSIACILVSRSKKYREFEPARPEGTGELGIFDRQRALLGLTENDPRWKARLALDLSNPDVVPESYGSGVVLDAKERLILTQAHVVREATKIYVRLPDDDRGSWADVYAADPRSDLAVLKLIQPVKKLEPLELGDGEDLRKGDFILSLSNPFAAGFRDGSPSASWGIVSNLRRRSSGHDDAIQRSDRTRTLPLHSFGTLIQTDTRMNLGCSGGALLNLQGKLVGLTTALAGISGGETPGGFAVPLDAGTRNIIKVLRRGEEVEYGFLGVYLRDPREMPKNTVRIASVAHGGPAQRAGIHGDPQRNVGGDYILAINGKQVHNLDELFLLVGMNLAGSTIRVEVSPTPKGPGRTCEVTLAKFPTSGQVIAAKRPAARRGLRVDWTSTLPPRFQSIPEGVVIREVLSKSPADKARLQQDQIIKSVNDQPVRVPADFYREMDHAKGKPVRLKFLTSDGREEDLTLPEK
jgi:S1-C subfamily serine protease